MGEKYKKSIKFLLQNHDLRIEAPILFLSFLSFLLSFFLYSAVSPSPSLLLQSSFLHGPEWASSNGHLWALLCIGLVHEYFSLCTFEFYWFFKKKKKKYFLESFKNILRRLLHLFYFITLLDICYLLLILVEEKLFHALKNITLSSHTKFGSYNYMQNS